MSLLSLPLEILRQIVQETIPRDFEATALSCKTLLVASDSFLAQYNTRRKRFRHFKFSKAIKDDGYDDNISQVEDESTSELEYKSEKHWDGKLQEARFRIMTTRALLEQIALDPSIVEYIESIDMRGSKDKVDDDCEGVISSLQTQVSDTLRKLVLESPFIQETASVRDAEDWISEIQNSTVYADVFLMTMLSQVRKLTVHTRWDDLRSPGAEEMDSPWSVLKMIIQQANHPEMFPNAPLSKLAIIESPRGPGYEEKSPLTPFAPFFALSSLCEASLTSCVLLDDGYTGRAFDPVVESYSPNLRKLTLESSVIGAPELSKLLSRTPNLEVFEFTHETKWHGCGYYWNAGAVLHAVYTTCANTLKKLYFTLYTGSYGEVGGTGATLVDMTRFQKLGVLDLDVSFLSGPPYEYDRSRDDWYDYEGEYHDANESMPAWPRLIDMLPVSLEKLNLYLHLQDSRARDAVPHLVMGLTDESRAAKLPRLVELKLYVRHFRSSPPDEEHLEILQTAKSSGFSVLDLGTDQPMI